MRKTGLEAKKRLRWGLILGALLTAVVLVGVGCATDSPTPTPETVDATPTVETAEPAPTPESVAADYANPQLLVETDWLAEHLGDDGLRIVDVRSSDDYAAGHIPLAVSIPRSGTYDPDAPKGIIATQDAFEALMGENGIGNDTQVIIYDEGFNTAASRVFWSLEYYGHRDKVAVLNGGFTKWQTEELNTSVVEPDVAPAVFAATPNDDILSTKDKLLEVIGKEGVVILDARSAAEYSGEDVRAIRGGHIPGAVNRDWKELFVSVENPVFKSADELAALYEDLGMTKDKEVHAY